MSDPDLPVTLIYLAGSSYPAGQAIERNLEEGLAGRVGTFLTQEAVVDRCGGGALSNDVAERIVAITPLVAELVEAGERVILAGRSSGARTATRFAHDAPPRLAPAAVIGVGYPFRLPRGPDQPERYAHLADLATPTLILHGRQDPYGGPDAVGAYPLSAAIDLRWIDTDHEFKLTPEHWAEVVAEIAGFLDRLPCGGVRSPLPSGAGRPDRSPRPS